MSFYGPTDKNREGLLKKEFQGVIIDTLEEDIKEVMKC